ncbi:hypothetical protein MOV66_00110 [Agrobacterium sp. SHOUNA12C]|jgi:hypothetical protein|uniref:hypothetical protein n=1 Tax=Rhizobium rhizogenes TaxID=359 RepID=UPI0015725721|nr:hypothetical protein [Rhizobium rhizogenes]MCJ9720023.1 hypothetical protein [Agrobacterium sp. BETTINA12B]MCJ9755042.1 hypothetical protein [Agrobacterium sp. SHOUNA12C]NTF52767.1 hypothetical protein [Rhizobium rhizogenes]NTF98468.1 hypothetical protein [Rhizobium rhizogenes]NTG18284.1 hypothetical protein [Rhizobium rhizogenes]
MIEDDDTNVVISSKSKRIIIDGYLFSIDIHRLETDRAWTLEVIDCEATSHVWDEQFPSDSEARDTAIKVIEREGAIAFMLGTNVIPFRQL